MGQYKKQLEAQGWVYEMEVSFVEIYNEQVRDLLRSLNPDKTAVEVRAFVGGWRCYGVVPCSRLRMQSAHSYTLIH